MSATAVLPSQPAKCPLPLQSIPKSTSATIQDQQGKLVAHCALVQCTKSQAYFIVQQLDSSIAPKAVTVQVPDLDRPFDLRIVTEKNEHPNRQHLPMYIQVHFNAEERYPVEHLLDLLAETVLGNYNLELRKNLTIDLFDSGVDAIIRDRAGFIVADRHRLQQITVDVKQSSTVLKPSKDVLISSPSTDLTELLDYDDTLSSHQRSDFLRFLLADHNALVAHWSPEKLAFNARQKEKENSAEKEDEKSKAKKGSPSADSRDEAKNTVAGYLISSVGGRVLGLYAENEEVAEALLASHVSKIKNGTLVFCCAATQWSNLRKLSTLRTRPIYRRHTRMVPANVKYDKVFAWNVGMNFF